MTHTTLAGWKQNIGIRLVTSVPTLNFNDGITFADSYLSRHGGWIPDNPGAPTDLGAPASGATDDEVVEFLLEEINTSQYEFTATINIPVSLTIYANLLTGMNPTQVRDSVASQVRDYIEHVSKNIALDLDPSVLNYVNFNSNVVGILAPNQRIAIQAAITATPVPILSGALVNSRKRFSLSPLWNFSNVYVDSETEMRAIMIKYADMTFNAVDQNEPSRIIVSIDPFTGAVLTGIKS